MHPITIRTLVDYHYWANRRILRVVESLSQEQFTRGLGSSFPSIQATLAHLINAEAIWLNRCAGEPIPATHPADLPGPAAVGERWRASEARLRSLVAEAQPADLAQPVVARPATGGEFTHPLWEVVQHLANHGTYHRGQLTTMLRQVGAQPVSTDLIRYFRKLRDEV